MSFPSLIYAHNCSSYRSALAWTVVSSLFCELKAGRGGLVPMIQEDFNWVVFIRQRDCFSPCVHVSATLFKVDLTRRLNLGGRHGDLKEIQSIRLIEAAERRRCSRRLHSVNLTRCIKAILKKEEEKKKKQLVGAVAMLCVSKCQVQQLLQYLKSLFTVIYFFYCAVKLGPQGSIGWTIFPEWVK